VPKRFDEDLVIQDARYPKIVFTREQLEWLGGRKGAAKVIDAAKKMYEAILISRGIKS